ncbi:MAG: hypothetical protein HY537_10270 [Deltaproteobacteria bacterium]|nr:hypothetical protein [Deltaproteobacteria bacterium]
MWKVFILIIAVSGCCQAAEKSWECGRLLTLADLTEGGIRAVTQRFPRGFYDSSKLYHPRIRGFASDSGLSFPSTARNTQVIELSGNIHVGLLDALDDMTIGSSSECYYYYIVIAFPNGSSTVIKPPCNEPRLSFGDLKKVGDRSFEVSFGIRHPPYLPPERYSLVTFTVDENSPFSFSLDHVEPLSAASAEKE